MKPQLTISLLASDRRETLEKCLTSLIPFLNELESELILVFTGSDPAVLDLAKRYTSHIIPFAWCDDFSKARNAGLKEANGEWFLYLDDDEWFEDPTEIIQFFKTGEYRNYQSAWYIQRNYDDMAGRHFTDVHVGRMCRLTAETSFIYPIHESLSPFPDPWKYFQSYVHHFGYVENEVSSTMHSKFKRNVALLLKSHEENPTAQNCMQLAQEYRNIKDETTAITYCREGLELAAKEKRIHTYELWMQVHLPLMLSATGNPEEAMREGERLLRSPRLLEVGQAHIHTILATLCWELDEYKKGLRHVLDFQKIMEYLEKHPDKATRQTGVSVTFSTAKEHAISAYIAGLLFAAALEEPQQLQKILTWIPWDDEAQIKRHYDNLERLKWGHPEQKKSILEAYSLLQTDHAYVNLQKALYYEEKYTLTKAEEYYKRSACNCPPEFIHQLVELAKRNDFSLNPLIEHISIEMWDEYAEVLSENTDISDMPKSLQKINSLLTDYPLCIGRLEQCFLEKQLFQRRIDTPQLLNLLEQYCKSICREARALCKEDILSTPDYYALPYRYKFALIAERILSNFDSKRYADCIPLLKKAVHAYPQMSIVISRLSEYMEEKMHEPQPPVSDEFSILGSQVKQVLNGLIANRQWGEACTVAEQLLALLPGDLEVLEMKQEILRQINNIEEKPL